MLTPTCHLFKMYIPFQDATSLPVSYDHEPQDVRGDYRVPAVNATAARGTDGRLYASLGNLDPHEAVDVRLSIDGGRIRNPSAQLLTAAAMDGRNTFESPSAVRPEPFEGFEGDRDTLTLMLPAKSILMIALGE